MTNSTAKANRRLPGLGAGQKPADKNQTTTTAEKGENPIMKGRKKKEPEPHKRASAEPPAEKPIEITSAEEMPGPSPAELALIAAALRGRDEKPPDFLALASEALRLWQACENEIRLSRERVLPLPKQYPVSFDEFLKLMLPPKRVEDRESAFRLFLRDWLRKDQIEVIDSFIWYKDHPFTEEQQYLYIGTLFRAWNLANRSIQKKLNGAKSWKGLKIPTEGSVNYTEADAHKDRRAAIMAAEATTGWID